MARMNVLADVVKGLKANIHAVDNLSPVSRVAVYVRAGSRYEPDAVPGITHFLKASAGLTTRDSSIFGMARHIEGAGSALQVTSDREYIVYRVDCLRDKLSHVLRFIDDTLHKPEFRSWELADVVEPRLKEELARFKKNQALVTNEALHKAAYRGGLAHSVFTPEHQIKNIKNNHLFQFVENNFVLERMSFVGLGVDGNEFRHQIEDQFSLNDTKYTGVSGATRYVGGEARIQAGFPHTMVNYVVQGRPITDLKGLACLEVIGTALGGYGQRFVKHGAGTEKSLVHLLSKLSPAFKTSIVNINHSDTGLFGFSILGPNEHMMNATKTAVKHVKKTLSSMNENDLKVAKQVTKARSLIQCEDHDALFNAMARSHAAGIVGDSFLNHVDSLTLNDVQTVAGSLLKGKPTLVSVGNPRYVPYVDEIES